LPGISHLLSEVSRLGLIIARLSNKNQDIFIGSKKQGERFGELLENHIGKTSRMCEG
jgi:hypothetical protein